MINILFTCSWGESPFQLLNKYKKQTPNSIGVWSNIRGVSKIEECDVIINMGDKVPIGLPEDKIIKFRREPNIIESFSNTHRSFNYDNGYHVSTWQYISKTFDDLKKDLFYKNKNVSGVTSNKHKHRNIFFEKIKSLNLDIDIYGKNFKPLDKIYKDEALINYKFSISIENCSQKNYFSEKINDCLLYETMPLYWGCPNIEDFFPKNSYRIIDIKNMENIKEIVQKPLSEKEIIDMKEAKKLIMYEYNIWPTIQKIIK